MLQVPDPSGNVMTQMGLTDIYRTFYPNTKEYTFFSAPHGTLYELDHILSNKANLYRYKKNWSNPCILLDHHGLILEFITTLLEENLQTNGN